MGLKRWGTVIRSKLKSHEDPKHVVNASDFLANGAQQPAPNTAAVHSQSGSPQSASAPPFSPDSFHSPLLYPNPNGIIVAELDASKRMMPNGRQPDAFDNSQTLEAKLKAEEAEEMKRAEEEKVILERKREECKDKVRELRGLIRERHRLDLFVWQNRDVQKADQEFIMSYCIKSDEILQRIYSIAESWEMAILETEEEGVAAQKIKDSLAQKDQPAAIWQKRTPWEREEDVNARGR